MSAVGVVVSRQLIALREKHGVSQDEVARGAHGIGLTWTRSTVAYLESQKRAFSAEELLLFPYLVAHVFGEDINLEQVFSQVESLELGVDSAMSGAEVVAALSGCPSDFSADVVQEAVESSAGDAEYKAARRFNVSVVEVLNAAVKLWGHSLTHERDQRTKAVLDEGVSLRSVQAIRGRVTLKLVEDLESIVREQRER